MHWVLWSNCEEVSCHETAAHFHFFVFLKNPLATGTNEQIRITVQVFHSSQQSLITGKLQEGTTKVVHKSKWLPVPSPNPLGATLVLN